MNDNLSVLLIEDDKTSCKNIRKYVDELEDIRLVGVTGDSDEGISYTKSCLPEAVILDIELHCGRGNGLEYLTQLKALNLPFRPYVLVTTQNTSPVTYDFVRKAGADFILAKYQAGYTDQSPVNFLQLIKNTILERIRTESPRYLPRESAEEKKRNGLRKIFVEFDRVGINPKHLGSKYLADAIQMVLEKPTTNICALVGKKYGKTEASVERAMQNAIERAWRTCSIEDLLKYYTARISSERGVPTIMEFVHYYAQKLENE